jgi:hypothetical protein
MRTSWIPCYPSFPNQAPLLDKTNNVRFGSKADVRARIWDVRLTPKSGPDQRRALGMLSNRSPSHTSHRGWEAARVEHVLEAKRFIECARATYSARNGRVGALPAPSRKLGTSPCNKRRLRRHRAQLTSAPCSQLLWYDHPRLGHSSQVGETVFRVFGEVQERR